MKANQITIPCRLSYVHVFQAGQVNGQGEAKYSVACLIDKSDAKTVDAIKKAIMAAVQDDQDNKRTLGANFKLKSDNQPLKDGDEKYPGMDVYYINAKSTRRPAVVDRARKPIMDEEEVYSGCFGYVAMTFYAYNTSGNKGIAAALDAVMKTKDGDRLDGAVNVDDAFAGVEDDAFGGDDDFMS